MPVTLTRVNVGDAVGDGNGDDGRAAFQKVNGNYDLLEMTLEDAERKAFTIALTDENETLADRLTFLGDDDLSVFRFPYAFVLLDVRASLKVPDCGQDVVLDVLEEGVSVLDSNGLIIPAGALTSVGYSILPMVDHVILEDDAEITIQHVSSSTGTAAAGLKISLIGYVIWTTF